MPNMLVRIPLALVMMNKRSSPPIYARDHSDVYMFLRQVEDNEHYDKLCYEYKLVKALGGYDYDW